MADVYSNINALGNGGNSRHDEWSWQRQWLSLLLFLFIGLIIISAVALINLPEKTRTLLTLFLQNLIPFAAAAVMAAALARPLTSKRPLADMLYLNRAPRWRWILLVTAAWIIMLPAMNALVAWNESLHLPQGMVRVEEAFRASEDMAQALTASLLNTSDVAMMLLLVLIIGVITGIGEEMFFRAGMLRPMIEQHVNPHVAIWVVAAIFSAIHFQFFGFVPRMLLGAWLGYLLLWSQSLWVPIIAHALNNSAVVVASFLANIHLIDADALDSIGLAEKGQFPWLAITSAVAWLALAVAIAKKSKKIEPSSNID